MKDEYTNTSSISAYDLSMLNALSSPASSINICNVKSDFGRFYHMNVPFQITLEYCNGSELEDYVNVVTLSANKSLMYQESFATKNYARSKDALHFHDFYEFVIVLEGNIIQKIEGKDYLYSAGSCCLINRSLCHLEHYHDRTKVLFIGMSAEFISELFANANNSTFTKEKEIFNSKLYQFITNDLKNPGQKAYLDFLPAYQNHQTAVYLHTLAESMIHTLLYPDFGTSYQIRGQLCAFLAYISSAQHYHCTTVYLNSTSDFLLFSRITHLFEESNGRMSRNDFEKLLNYSGDYLNRIVNKYTGMCLYDYGMTFCLKKAATYLTETNESISTIAAKLHFSNRTHFYTLFKEKYGVTPNEYRNSHYLSGRAF